MRIAHSPSATPTTTATDYIAHLQWQAFDLRVSLAACVGPTDAELLELEEHEELPPHYEFVDVGSNGILSGLLVLSADRPFKKQ